MPPRTPPQKSTRWRGTARDIRPMLAELVDPALHEHILRRPDLVFEPKYDGMRAVIAIDPEPSVRIYSRLGNDKTEQFPEIVEPLLTVGRRLPSPVVVDGEMVAVDDDGQALGFQHLQGRLHVRGLKSHSASRGVSVAFIAFDLLTEGDADLRPRPFSERRHRLAALFRRPGSKKLRLIESKLGGGMRLRATARRRGWEGIVAKEPNSRYISGEAAGDMAETEIRQDGRIRGRGLDRATSIENPLRCVASWVLPRRAFRNRPADLRGSGRLRFLSGRARPSRGPARAADHSGEPVRGLSAEGQGRLLGRAAARGADQVHGVDT